MIDVGLVVCAFVGGLIASLMTYYEDPMEAKTISPCTYWSRLLLFNPFCGAFCIAVLLYDGPDISHSFSAYIGLSSPIILKQALTTFVGPTLQGKDIETQ